MTDLFTQNLNKAKNPSVLRLINEYERQYSETFNEVKKYWNNSKCEFLHELNVIIN